MSGIAALLLIGLTACDGGLTDTEQADSTYTLKNLPSRISPDIPADLARGHELTSTDNHKEFGSSTRDHIDEGDRTFGWYELNMHLSTVALERFRMQAYSTLVDLAFDDILKECTEQLIDCTISAGRINVTVTQDVVNRLQLLHTEWKQGLSYDDQESFFSEEDGFPNGLIATGFESLLNTELKFGETRYSQLDGAPYDHLVKTSISTGGDARGGFFEIFQETQNFSAHWHEDGQVAKFTYDENLTDSGQTIRLLSEYFYQNNVPSELMVGRITSTTDNEPTTGVYTKLLANDPSQAGVLVEAAGLGLVTRDFGTGSTDGISAISSTDVTSDTGGTGVGSAGGPIEPNEITDAGSTGGVFEQGTESFVTEFLAYSLFRGQLDNGGGYATYDERGFDLPDQQTRLTFEAYREVYDSVGRRLAEEGCSIGGLLSGFYDNCDENTFVSNEPEQTQVSDSIHYFADDEFDSLVMMQDAISWEVQGVPEGRKMIGVISAVSQTNLADSELLCQGFQYVAGDAHIFCTATDEQLENTVVVEMVDGVATQVISDANLVQTQ